MWQHLLSLYDIYEIENPDPLPNKHFFIRKLESLNANRKDNPELSNSTTITKFISSPDQLHTKDVQDFLHEYDPEFLLTYNHIMDVYTKESKEDDTKKSAELKMKKDLEKLMTKVNKRYAPKASPASPNDREHKPLKEAFNFPAIQ